MAVYSHQQPCCQEQRLANGVQGCWGIETAVQGPLPGSTFLYGIDSEVILVVSHVLLGFAHIL